MALNEISEHYFMFTDIKKKKNHIVVIFNTNAFLESYTFYDYYLRRPIEMIIRQLLPLCKTTTVMHMNIKYYTIYMHKLRLKLKQPNKRVIIYYINV